MLLFGWRFEASGEQLSGHCGPERYLPHDPRLHQSVFLRVLFNLILTPTKALVIPAAYFMSQTVEDNLHVFMETGQPSAIEEHCRSGLLFISRGTAILLLFVYAAYLFFQLKTHAYLFQASEGQEEEESLEMSTTSAGVALLSVTVVTSFAADYRE